MFKTKYSRNKSNGSSKGGGSGSSEASSRQAQEKSALKSLGAAIGRVEDPFFCSGEIRLAAPITLLLKHRKRPDTAPHIPLRLPKSLYDAEHEETTNYGSCMSYNPWGATGTLDETPLTSEAWKAFGAFEVSPFGRDQQTVVDESVRKATQVMRCDVDRRRVSDAPDVLRPTRGMFGAYLCWLAVAIWGGKRRRWWSLTT